MSLWRRILVERRSIILPLTVLLAANAVVLIAVVLPLRRSVAGANEKRTDATTALLLARRDLNEIEHAANSKRQTGEELQQFYEKILPATSSAATKDVAFWPWDTARALSLQYTSIETSQPIEIRESRLRSVTSRFTLRGEYQNIRKFVYAVEAAEKFLVIDKIKLAQPGSQLPNSSVLEFELTIATFYLGGGQ